MGVFDMTNNVTLGRHLSISWQDDPIRLTFMFARYKHVARLLKGKRRVLEVGCGDGFCTGIVRQFCDEVYGIDINGNDLPKDDTRYQRHDITQRPFAYGVFDAAYSLDCLEHIKPELTDTVIRNIMANVNGPLIIGMPSLESQTYASPRAKAEHVNCMTQEQLRATMLRHFKNVFMLGVQDETLTTGYGPMCQYHLAIGADKL